MAAGVSTTCALCKAVIETPARDLVVAGRVLERGCVIDLDENWRAFVAHYEAEHPDVDVPERFL
jgi:hypothetical protein